ncbi:hypothetical protein EIP91_001148 [Steccherinum ochraceum]|uniref:DUF7330 domain-containing protein n=1 Tax=Steccherinum ochraceum TaxID=92696 RepID=A0A4R0REL6_9APHY|nr:hypothetical protein EIP91_001148 [Steccherinum ochraceum]
MTVADEYSATAPLLPRASEEWSTTTLESPHHDFTDSNIDDDSQKAPPQGILPLNFQRVVQRNGITGTFVVDLDLQIPEELLAPISLSNPGERGRQNLFLQASNNVFNADVWTRRSQPSTSSELRKAAVTVRSTSSSYDLLQNELRLHIGSGTSCNLVIYTQSNLSLAIPSDLVGPVTLNVDSNSIYYSPSIRKRLITFGEEDGKRYCFLGDMKRENYTSRDAWQGSSISVTIAKSWGLGKLHMYALGEANPRPLIPRPPTEDSTESTCCVVV